MKTVGIIAEYNPFHRGHAFHLEQAKKLTGADYAVIVMSGSFVQRGFPALADKYARARMALAAGADLVLELPTPYAVGSAEDFARGAVSVLESLGCIDALCFGSECGDLPALLPYARLFETEPKGYQELLRTFLKEGLSFPAARSRAAEEYLNYTERILPCSSDDAGLRLACDLLSSPNNLLGIEYCRALMQKNSSITPLTIGRISSGYHDLSMDTGFASASAIRKRIFQEGLSEAVQNQLPPASCKILKACLSSKLPVSFDDFSSVLLYRLLSLSRKELMDFQDIPEDLAARMENLRFFFQSSSHFARLLKTKQYTLTRITRALCHILLNLRQTDLESLRENRYPVYLRVLGFRKTASPLLAAVKKKGASPLLVKAADAPHLLTPVQLSLFEKDVFGSHLYETARVQKGFPFRNEYTRSPYRS